MCSVRLVILHCHPVLSRTSDHDQYENQTDDHPDIHNVLPYLRDTNLELWLGYLHCRDHKEYHNCEFWALGRYNNTVDSVTLESNGVHILYDGSDIGTHGRDCPTR